MQQQLHVLLHQGAVEHKQAGNDISPFWRCEDSRVGCLTPGGQPVSWGPAGPAGAHTSLIGWLSTEAESHLRPRPKTEPLCGIY